MIRVTIELISSHGAHEDKVLGVMDIVNDGTGTAEIGNYDVRLSKGGPMLGETWKRGRVEGFHRLRRGVYDLLSLALDDALTAGKTK